MECVDNGVMTGIRINEHEHRSNLINVSNTEKIDQTNKDRL